MARLNPKDHFLWMTIAGAVISVNGVLQLLAGNAPLGIASLVLGPIAVVLGLVRPRIMDRQWRPRGAAGESAVAAAPGLGFAWLRPLGLLLLTAALLLGLFSGLPAPYRNNLDLPPAAVVSFWALWAGGLALLVFGWRRARAAGRGRGALIAGIVIAALGAVAAATPVTSLTVTGIWKAANPPDLRLVYAVDPDDGAAPDEALMALSAARLARYLEAAGQFHPPERGADGSIVLLLAGPDTYELEELRDLIDAGYLAFHEVHEESDSRAAAVQDGAPAPAGFRLLAGKEGPLLVGTQPLLTGAAVEGVWMRAGDQGRTVVDAIFDEAGAARLAEITAANIGRRLAVVMGERVLMAPTVREAIRGGRLTISGDFGDGEAFDLGRALRLGGLPAPLVLVSEETLPR